MRLTIFNSKYCIIEKVIVDADSISYTDIKGDQIPVSNVEILIDKNDRYVNIDNCAHRIIKIEPNMNTWLRFERLEDNDLPLPSKATAGAAGLDFAACLKRPCRTWINGVSSDFKVETPSLLLQPGQQVAIALGFKVQFDSSHALMLYLRSSSGIKGMMLSNLVGVIDSDYRGELFAAIYNRTNEVIEINHGDRIVQGILTPTYDVVVTEGLVDNTVRGEGGLGSTGK